MSHDDRLEPDDSTIAALQSETVRQRENDENMLAVAQYAHGCTAEQLMADAAVLIRAYEMAMEAVRAG